MVNVRTTSKVRCSFFVLHIMFLYEQRKNQIVFINKTNTEQTNKASRFIVFLAKSKI